MASNH